MFHSKCAKLLQLFKSSNGNHFMKLTVPKLLTPSFESHPPNPNYSLRRNYFATPRLWEYSTVIHDEVSKLFDVVFLDVYIVYDLVPTGNRFSFRGSDGFWNCSTWIPWQDIFLPLCRLGNWRPVLIENCAIIDVCEFARDKATEIQAWKWV